MNPFLVEGVTPAWAEGVRTSKESIVLITAFGTAMPYLYDG
ncbi:MAG: hypothetical protein AB1861_23065 [Cyanobacteriota bacterium]